MAVDMLVDVRAEFSDADHPYPISGCLGPRDDGYRPDQPLTADAAAAYHRPQIETLADTPADLVTALTLTHPAEAIGIAVSARDAEMPAVLSFTVETDGKLSDGTALADAIASVDDATDAYPATT
jgi:S-methylmethionine-dependent homocysteine/selenocysteine methylase